MVLVSGCKYRHRDRRVGYSGSRLPAGGEKWGLAQLTSGRPETGRYLIRPRGGCAGAGIARPAGGWAVDSGLASALWWRTNVNYRSFRRGRQSV